MKLKVGGVMSSPPMREARRFAAEPTRPNEFGSCPAGESYAFNASLMGFVASVNCPKLFAASVTPLAAVIVGVPVLVVPA